MNIAQLVMDTANAYGVPPQLALELAIRESKLNPSAKGPVGEIGVMQLTPATAAELGVNPYDVTQNVQGGVIYLRQQLDRFGDFARALAAYNCGPGCVAKAITNYGAEWFRGVPASTRDYVNDILAALGTAWQVAPGVPVASPDAVMRYLQNVPEETWRRIALYAGIGLLIYFGTRRLAGET